MNTSKMLLSPSMCSNVTRAVSRGIFTLSTTSALRGSCSLGLHASRNFSTSRRSQIEFFPPTKETDKIRETRPAWRHYETTEEQLNNIQIDHRETRTWSDAWALGVVKLLRWGTNIATGYRHDESKPYIMSEKKWLVRFIFLETVAGVPGMTAGMLRHFRSLRRLQRDQGWMETMLEDAYNERMHLLTFMKMAEPGWFMKFLILGAQGVFANGFFLSYIIAPKMCHRFVGYLEEEAVRTYTYAIEDLDKGRLPGWEKLQAPEIAVTYWNMPEGKRTMRDLLLYVRADEAKHREIHHTFGNLDQKNDPNPFVSEYKDESKPHPGHGFKHLKSKGWEREDVI